MGEKEPESSKKFDQSESYKTDHRLSERLTENFISMGRSEMAYDFDTNVNEIRSETDLMALAISRNDCLPSPDDHVIAVSGLTAEGKRIIIYRHEVDDRIAELSSIQSEAKIITGVRERILIDRNDHRLTRVIQEFRNLVESVSENELTELSSKLSGSLPKEVDDLFQRLFDKKNLSTEDKVLLILIYVRHMIQISQSNELNDDELIEEKALWSLGEIINRSRLVCRHVQLLVQIMAYELGLRNVSMVRGLVETVKMEEIQVDDGTDMEDGEELWSDELIEVFDEPEAHDWNEILIGDRVVVADAGLSWEELSELESVIYFNTGEMTKLYDIDPKNFVPFTH